MDITDLLSQLESSDCPIKDRKMLVSSLRDLDNMVGMTTLKRAVIDQLLFFLANIRTKGIAHATDGHVLHTLLYGPPGVGKTVVGSILARIWSSVGILGQRSTEPEPLAAKFLRDNINLLVLQKLSLERVERASTAAEATRLKIREMRAKIFALRTRSRRRNTAYDNESLHSELTRIDSEVQKLARISSDAFNYCAMTLHSLEDKIIVPPIDSSPIIVPTPPLFKVVSRVNMVAEFLGQTAVKTKKLLEDHQGGVLLVDEAYSLYQGDRDSFGAEALTVINQYMSENADKTVLIFAGYKSALQSSVFKVQPGLARRFAFTFEITGYEPHELAQIFLQQLIADGWTLECEEPVIYMSQFFTDHKEYFKSYGGDTKRLIFQCKMVSSSYNWNNPEAKPILTTSVLTEALVRYKLNQPLNGDKLELFEAQRTYEEESLLAKVREFHERKKHEKLYDEAREQDREDLRRKITEGKERKTLDDRFKEAPTGMYM